MECNLCNGPADSPDGVSVVTWKTDSSTRTVVQDRITVFICKDCMDRYKAQKYTEPKRAFLFAGIFSMLVGIGFIIFYLIKGLTIDGAVIGLCILLVVITPLAFWFLAKRLEKQYGPNSAPLSPQKLPIDSVELSAAVYDCAGDVEYAFLTEFKKHETNPSFEIPKRRAYPISFYTLHPLNKILESRPPQIKQVTMLEEAKSFLKKLAEQYGIGKEFKVRDAFGLISDGYLTWYTKQAQAHAVYSIDSRESATLELLEFFESKKIIGNKRKVVRNNFGDEEWFYTVYRTDVYRFDIL